MISRRDPVAGHSAAPAPAAARGSTTPSSSRSRLRRQYSLGYYPKTAGRDGERRQIKVQVGRPELVVQARDSYVYSRQKAEDKGAGGDQLKGQGSRPQRLDGMN